MSYDYASLQDRIADYLGRADLAARIPDFIRFAEARFNRTLRLKSMEREARNTLTPKQASIVLPDRRDPARWDVFLEMRDLRLDGARLDNLDFMAVDNIPEERLYGKPYAYSIRGRELYMTPVPDAPYKLLLTYYAEVPPLSEAQPVNDILLRSPDLYVYGALVESAAYTRSSVPVEQWAAAYLKAAGELQKSDISGRFTANIAIKPIRSI